MRNYTQFYIDGQWVDPITPRTAEVINPATEEVSGQISLGSPADVDKAVAAARKAFATYSQTSAKERLDLLETIQAEYAKRESELGEAIMEEMGAPRPLACGFHTMLGSGHLATAIEVLKTFKFEEERGVTLIRKEPIGVCGLITPWNWPMNQTCVKIFPALATGCTMILKPPQLAPYSAQILAEILHDSGVPAGVFNMVQGKGSEIGTAMSTHQDIDMISFTGSEPVGVQIQKDAADTVKRVGLELGGKSPWIVLDDASLAAHVAGATAGMMGNSGQTCSAGSRLLVPNSRMDEVKKVAAEAANGVTVGDPNGNFAMGPVVSKRQYNIIQQYIEKGLEEGAELIAGGAGRPEGLDKGWYVKPTVFVGTNQMVIAREEIFGPVLVIIGYDDLDHAVEIANDSAFGLGGYVSGEDLDTCRALSRKMRTGAIWVNGGFDFHAPFGGYKRSGNGREWGDYGFEEYLETKAVIGWNPA
ncbi:aldehyde dehydrogenase family protein [Novosphingobium mangrovi (ex Huang et al. 2023)]|uniref:Aldehyde dehydrogenase family protein n=1 Tax=Novosphingobium mangrovi (ex Huang et al. 2023) TaxID=2976432 RepID=A0ABT2I8E5_9SPHN|nr:aldehyde dehydrogenase family protein [Novosphingobium mangrovi (ex Huang et al. 2023)]MCT2401101.1 aldehyde dehydrogenase family protein [Novosphingobium mangrovi (ex Huang et al. 2023)]